MQKVIVDCTPVMDEMGRTLPSTYVYADLTPAEQDEYNARPSVLPKMSMAASSSSGRVPLTLLDGITKAVTFPSALRSADYVVMLNPAGGSVAASLWTTAHTATGFTLNLSAAVTGTIEYVAQVVT